MIYYEQTEIVNYLFQIVPTAIIVDDYVENAEIMEHYIELLGIRVLAIGHDGKQAVELYQRLRPYFVFLDVQMPNYDGYFALTKIKQFNPSAKIIMITADTSVETKQKLTLLGATDILYKPIDHCLMKEIITSYNRLQSVALR